MAVPKDMIDMLRSYRETRDMDPVKPLTTAEVKAVASIFCDLASSTTDKNKSSK